MNKIKTNAKDKASPYCSECWRCSSKLAVCFPVEASLLERFIGNEVFECERCHQRYVIAPSD